jgi:hypothetical protein
MSLDKRSIELGTEGWGVKEDNLLAFRKDRTRYVEKPFTFSRGSGGTVVNKDGFIEQAGLTSNQTVSPLLSEIPDTVDATTLDRWDIYGTPIERSITDGKLVIETSGSNQGIVYAPIYESGKTYLVRFYAEGDPANVYISLGGAGAVTMAAPGEGWVEAVVNFPTTNHTISFRANGNNAGRTVYSSLTITEINVDSPRICYLNNPDGHLLLEPQSTNYAAGLQPADWHSSNHVNITRNAIQAPSGLNQASLVVKDVSSSDSYSRQSMSFSSGVGTQVVTASVFLKYYNNPWVYLRPVFWSGAGSTAGLRTWFDIQNGVIGTNNNENATIEDYGNGWYRCSVTWTIDKGVDVNGYLHIYNANEDNSTSQTVGQGYYAYGIQGEEHPFTTSYIPSQSSPNTVFGRTRTVELANSCGESQDFEDYEGVLFVEMAPIYRTVSGHLSISDDTNNHAVTMRIDNTSNQLTLWVRNNGAYTMLNTFGVQEGFNRVALKYKSNDFEIFLNGVSVHTDTSGSTPVGLKRLSFTRFLADSPFYGKVKELKVYTEALNDAELRLLTKYAPKDYDAAFTADYVDNLAEFTVLRTEATDKLYYSISDGTNSVSGSATITATQVTISNIDISSLTDGTLTLSVYIEDERKQRGVTVTDTTIKDTTNTPLYSYALQQRATGATFEDLDNSESIIESLNVEV